MECSWVIRDGLVFPQRRLTLLGNLGYIEDTGVVGDEISSLTDSTETWKLGGQPSPISRYMKKKSHVNNIETAVENRYLYVSVPCQSVAY